MMQSLLQKLAEKTPYFLGSIIVLCCFSIAVWVFVYFLKFEVSLQALIK